MHRNTFYFIVILGIFAAIVVGVNIGRSALPNTNQTQTTTPTQALTTPTPELVMYQSKQCGISFSYPDKFNKIDIETGGATLVNKENTNESIILVCQKDIPRIPLTDDKIEQRAIGTVSAFLYHDTSQKDGTPLDKLIFTHPALKKDVYIAGYGETFNNIISSLSLYSSL